MKYDPQGSRMNQQPTNNHGLFQTGRQRTPEASRSWWMDAKPDGFTRTAEERELPRMARSEGAKNVRGYTVGWAVSGRKS